MQFNKKLIMASVAALMAAGSLTALNTNNSVQAADTNVTNKIVMHTAVAYDKDGNSTGVKYNAFSYAKLVAQPVSIDGSPYYKVADKDQYLKATNIDGVTRKITHNTYIYRTSTGRTSYQGKWKLYKGQTITTYGGSYKFRNGKHYFRVGGPAKQYVKSYNLGPVVKANTVMGPSSSSSNTTTNKPTNSSSNTTTNTPTNSEETTVTVTSKTAELFTEVPNKDKVQPSGKSAKMGRKFVVDRLERGTRAGTGEDGDDEDSFAIYHIKGTDYWIYNYDVKADKAIPMHDYDNEYTSMIRFTKTTDLYNSDGTLQNIKLAKNSEQWKVNKLVYIWVPSENKAVEFYRLKPTKYWHDVLRLSSNGEYVSDYMPLKEDTYVKASDVKFETQSVALTPSNTPEEAQAAASKK